MKMTTTRLPIGLLIFIASLAAPVLASAKTPSGKQIFLDERCNLCHSISALGMKSKLDGRGISAKAPDLSSASELIRSEAWLGGFLHKQEETKEGHKHPKAFDVSPEELDSLADWLMSLKPNQATGGASKGASPREP